MDKMKETKSESHITEVDGVINRIKSIGEKRNHFENMQCKWQNTRKSNYNTKRPSNAIGCIFFLLFPIWEMFAQVPLSLFIVIIKTCANCFMWSYWGIVATKSRSSQLNPIMYEFAMKQNATRIMPAIFAIVNTCPQLAHTWLMVTHTILSILHAKMQTIQKLQKRNAHFMFSYFEKCLRWVQFNAMFCSCCIEP